MNYLTGSSFLVLIFLLVEDAVKSEWIDAKLQDYKEIKWVQKVKTEKLSDLKMVD